MILEAATLTIKDGATTEFKNNFKMASDIILR